MMIECIDKTEFPRGLEEAWNHLADIQQTPLLGFDWFSSCMETMHKNEFLRTFVLKDNEGSVLAIAPTVLGRKHGVPHLSTQGYSSLFEPGGILCPDGSRLKGFLEGVLKTTRAPVTFHRIYPSIINEEYGRMAPSAFRNSIRHTTGLPSSYIDLPAEWDIFLNGISSRRRYDYRRSRKRAMDSGTLSFKCITPSPGDVEDVLLSAYQVESSGWKGRNGSGLLNKKALHDFFINYGRKSASKGLLRVFFLSIDSEIVSTQIAIEAYRRLWILKIGYNEKWSKLSPGLQITMESIKYSIENNLDAYEFLGSDEDWVRIWTNRIREYQTLTLYPNSTAGFSGHLIDTATHMAGTGIRYMRNLSKRFRTPPQ